MQSSKVPGALLAAVLLLVVSVSANADSGADIFAVKCASCHGNAGQGTSGLAPALKGDPFVIHGKLVEIEDTIQNGRSGDQKKFRNLPVAMPAWHLSDADLRAVLDYIRSDLQKP
jgi:mono/diheme cytochrome c family protein